MGEGVLGRRAFERMSFCPVLFTLGILRKLNLDGALRMTALPSLFTFSSLLTPHSFLYFTMSGLPSRS